MENNSFTKKASQKVKSSYITSRNFSNFKRKSKRLTVNKIPNQEDSVKLAAKLVREEIRNTPNTYTNWPLTAAELLQRKTGSKKTIRWLNMFSHDISCNKTTQAEDEIQNQLTRSYYPTIAEPSVHAIFKLIDFFKGTHFCGNSIL